MKQTIWFKRPQVKLPIGYLEYVTKGNYEQLILKLYMKRTSYKGLGFMRRAKEDIEIVLNHYFTLGKFNQKNQITTNGGGKKWLRE